MTDNITTFQRVHEALRPELIASPPTFGLSARAG
jgi:hypothetical protein